MTYFQGRNGLYYIKVSADMQRKYDTATEIKWTLEKIGEVTNNDGEIRYKVVFYNDIDPEQRHELTGYNEENAMVNSKYIACDISKQFPDLKMIIVPQELSCALLKVKELTAEKIKLEAQRNILMHVVENACRNFGAHVNDEEVLYLIDEETVPNIENYFDKGTIFVFGTSTPAAYKEKNERARRCYNFHYFTTPCPGEVGLLAAIMSKLSYISHTMESKCISFIKFVTSKESAHTINPHMFENCSLEVITP